MMDSVTAWGPYVLMAVTAVLALAVVIRAVRLGVHIREMMGVRYHPFRRKKKLYLLTAVYFAACIAVFSLGLSRRCSGTLSFNYEGASRGLNPNETRFNQADILGRPVLERMVDKKILPGVTAEELAEVLHLSSEDQEPGREEDGDYRVSAEYQIEYTAGKHTSHLDGETVLQVFAGAYRDWFAQQSATDLSPLDMDFTKINQEDYLDICDHLDTEAKRIMNFMSVMNAKGSAFQSKETGEGFHSIQTRAGYITDTLTANLRAYILAHSLSKDTQNYLGRLSAENIFLDFDARKEQISSENWLSVIRRYEDDMARIVLVPTYDTKGQFYMSQTKIGVDEFAEQTEVHADRMINYHSLMADNDYLFQQLSAARGDAAAEEQAVRMIGQIEEELASTARRAQRLIEEYEAKQANGYMTVVIPPWEDRALSAVWKTGALCVVFLLLMHAMWFLSEVQRMALSRLVDTFLSKVTLPVQPPPGNPKALPLNHGKESDG